MGKIYEFDPVIYPTKVWVALDDVTIDEIDEAFEAICNDDTGVPFKENHTLLERYTDAKTIVVGCKEQHRTGCLVLMRKNTALKSLSHEADHCADYLFEEIGETERSYNHGEPYAYYQSWVFDCLYKVKKGEL